MVGKTENGFEFDVDERILNDWDYIESIDNLRLNSSQAGMKDVSAVIIRLLGNDGFEALKDFAREKNDGIADIAFIKNEFTEILSSTKVKNSPSSPSA